MNCPSCGARYEAGPFCPSCGARRPPGTSQSSDGWRDAGHKVSSLTVTVSTTCVHCAQPVPVNGPAESVHCPHCDKDMAVDRLAETLSAQSEGFKLVVGASIQATRSPDPSADCPRCGNPVSIAAYVHQTGATTTLPCPGCGMPIPSYPAPAWLKERLPTALQVFGGDADAAKAAGIDLRVDERAQAPVAMSCPSCGSGLTITPDTARTVACTFCKTSVFLPDAVWRRLHPIETMLRWTLTYKGKLATRAESEKRDSEREASQAGQRDRQARKEARRAMLQAGANVDPKRFLPSPARKKLGIVVGALAGVTAVIGIVAIAVVTFVPSVHGSMTSENAKLGRWTLDDSAWDTCQSGQSRGFFGVALFSKTSQQARLVLVQDGSGHTLEFGLPGTDDALRVPGAKCSKLDADVQRQASAVNHVRQLAGHVDFDCQLDEGRVSGSVTFSNCH